MRDEIYDPDFELGKMRKRSKKIYEGDDGGGDKSEESTFDDGEMQIENLRRSKRK